MLGVGLAQAGLAKRFGRGTTLMMVVTSNLPDIDVIGSWLHGEYGFMYRRMFTHSIFGIPVLALLAALFFHRFYNHISRSALFGLALLAMGVHVFFDLVNSYGVVILYPFSRHRFELAWIFIIDFVLWFLLLSPLLLSKLPQFKNRAQKMWRVALTCVSVYVALCASSRAYASHLLKNLYRGRPTQPEFTYVFPELLGPHRFRGVTRQGNTYSLYLAHPFQGKLDFVCYFETDEQSPVVQKIRQTKEAQELEWFYKAPVWNLIPHTSQARVWDIRFKSAVITGKQLPFSFRLGKEKS